MEIEAVARSYRRWAPIYDRTFGAVTRAGRRRAVEYINGRSGKVLEVGVGTGLSLGRYARHLEVTGIDFSGEMLAKARARVEAQGLDHVRELREMDARYLDFPDDHFDSVVAMHLISVVPEPDLVMAEMARVCRPGGEVVIISHFVREKGPLASIERGLAPLANVIGWHSDFEKERVLGAGGLVLREERVLPPFGLFSLLRLEKAVGAPR